MKLPLVICCLLGIGSQLAGGDDWPSWRGPNANGIAEKGQNLPHHWDAETNVVWKTTIPGRGHSSPIVVGNGVYLTTADDEKQIQSVLAFDRKTGKILWQTPVNTGGFAEQIHKKNTYATPTLTSDDERLYALFPHHGGLELVALNRSGKPLWRINAGAFEPHRFKFGYGPSPLLYQNLVIVASEFEEGFLAAFHRETGKEVWRIPRPFTSYSSPIVGHVAGRDQLLLTGDDRITAYDPLTGKELWQAPGCSEATCGTAVWEGDMVFASGGFPEKHTTGVLADGSGKQVWQNGVCCYEQSILVSDGYVYAVSDNGIAFCWRASDGEEMWKERLSGPISASPTLADGMIYQSNEKGTTFVFRANPEKFELVAENSLGTEAFASPTICGQRIFLRVADNTSSERIETLYCIGKTNTSAE